MLSMILDNKILNWAVPRAPLRARCNVYIDHGHSLSTPTPTPSVWADEPCAGNVRVETRRGDPEAHHRR